MSSNKDEAKTLRVKVINCMDLQSKDWFSKNDPFVVLQCGDHKHKTSVKKNAGSSATFNETFEFKIDESVQDGAVHVTVYDSDIIKDGFIGSTDIPIPELLTGPKQFQLFHKHNMKKITGYIQLVATGSGLEQFTAQIPQAAAAGVPQGVPMYSGGVQSSMYPQIQPAGVTSPGGIQSSIPQGQSSGEKPQGQSSSVMPQGQSSSVMPQAQSSGGKPQGQSSGVMPQAQSSGGMPQGQSSGMSQGQSSGMSQGQSGSSMPQVIPQGREVGEGGEGGGDRSMGMPQGGSSMSGGGGMDKQSSGMGMGIQRGEAVQGEGGSMGVQRGEAVQGEGGGMGMPGSQGRQQSGGM